MSHSAAPCESPPPSPLPGWQKRKTSYPTAAGFPAFSRWSYRASAFLQAFLPAFPKAPLSKNYRAFLDVKFFPDTSEAEIYAWILSAFPKSNKCVPDGYLNNKGGIGRVWRAASFPTAPAKYTFSHFHPLFLLAISPIPLVCSSAWESYIQELEGGSYV